MKLTPRVSGDNELTHWGRVMHICVGKLTINGSDNGLSPRRQAIIWSNAGILSIGTLGTNFNEILSEIHTFSFRKMHLNMSSAEMPSISSRPQCVNSLRPTYWANPLAIPFAFRHKLGDGRIGHESTNPTLSIWNDPNNRITELLGFAFLEDIGWKTLCNLYGYFCSICPI